MSSEWPLLWAVIAVVAAVTILIIQIRKSDNKKIWFIWVSLSIFLGGLVLATFVSAVFNNQYAKTPQVVGGTIENATDRILSSELEPKHILSEKAEKIELVVWQWPAAGELVKKDSPVYYASLSSTNFANTISLPNMMEQKSNDKEDDTIESLNYNIDMNYRWENRYSYFYEPHWEITVKTPKLDFRFEPHYINGRLNEYSNTTNWFGSFGKSMKQTLEKITYDTVNAFCSLYGYDLLKSYSLVGALVDEESEGTIPWKIYDSSDHNELFFMPERIQFENHKYKYVFCLYDKVGNCYSWYHYITVVPPDEQPEKGKTYIYDPETGTVSANDPEINE